MKIILRLPTFFFFFLLDQSIYLNLGFTQA